MLRKISILLFITLSLNVIYAQKTYTQTEVDLKLELQKKEMDAKLQELKREKEKADVKIEDQDKRLIETQNRLSKLVDIFSVIIALLTIGITIFGFVSDRRNQNRKQEMEDEFQQLKLDTEKQIDYIRDQARLVAEKAELMVEKSALEMENLKTEVDAYLKEFNNRDEVG